MYIKKEAVAGTLLSNDCYIQVKPHTKLKILLESTVMDRFGDEILSVTKKQLNDLGVEKGMIMIDDKGALNYTIQARIETAVKRANG